MCAQNAFRIVKGMRTTDYYNTTIVRVLSYEKYKQKCKMQEEEGRVKDSTDAQLELR